MLAGLKLALIGSAVALVVGFGTGWQVRSWKCSAAENKANVEHLERQIDAREAAAQANDAMLDQQAPEISNMERSANDIRGKISAGECFTPGDVDRLRQLWPSAE